MDKAQRFSERLGEISDRQLQQALDKHGLGELKQTEPISQGNFGQNLFLESSEGQYVLRGVPHYPWQFRTEKFFVEQLHDKTKVPVPYPYIIDEGTEIFGWSYVLMPRMKGVQLSDGLDEPNLTQEDRVEIAKAQGRNLAEAQRLTWEFPGHYDLTAGTIIPFQEPYSRWIEKTVERRVQEARAANPASTTDADLEWVRGILQEGLPLLEKPFTPTFSTQDYKPGNMIVDKVDGQWQVTGQFDLMEAHFGHSENDISRMFSVYITKGQPGLAYAFVNAYLSSRQPKDIEGFIKRFPLFILHERSIIWGWATKNNKVWWDKSLTLRQWLEPFMQLDVSKLDK